MITRMRQLEMKRKKQIMTSIQKNVSRAKSTGDDKRLGMVASRKKASDDHNPAAKKRHTHALTEIGPDGNGETRRRKKIPDE